MTDRLKLRITNPDAPLVDPQMARPREGYLAPECPPSVVTVGGRRQVFIACGRTMAVEVPADTHILRDRDAFRLADPVWSIGGFDAEITMGRLPLNARYDHRTMYWRKNYCGAYSVDVMPADAAHPEWVFSFNHGENKNEVVTTRSRVGTYYFHNSINSQDPAGPGTASGPGPDGMYREYQPAYFGFVTMAYAPMTAETGWGAELHRHDMGPLLWPHTAFLSPDGKRVADGFTHPHPHPSGLIAEDPRDGRTCIYVFANTCSEVPGKSSMVMAARAPLESRGLPGAFANLYEGEFGEPSLPADMQEDLPLLLTRKGGRASPLHPELHNVNRFSVARLRRSGLFLSVESYHAGGAVQTALRLSADLRTWGERVAIPNTRAGCRARSLPEPAFDLYYPRFLSADGSSHTLIDESEPFYLIATKPHALVYRELEIEL